MFNIFALGAVVYFSPSPLALVVYLTYAGLKILRIAQGKEE